MNYIGALAIDGKQVDFRENERLYRALELKLFEDLAHMRWLYQTNNRVSERSLQLKLSYFWRP